MQLLYFAWVKDRIGRAEEAVSPPAEVTDVAALLDWLEARSEGHKAALADRKAIRVAVNQSFAAPEDAIAAGDEVAVFPPVTGG